MKFPTIQTRDLNGDTQTLPTDFTGQINLLFVAYERWQQMEVNSWLPFANELENLMPTVRYYELPVVGNMGMLGQKRLDYIMRTGIRDWETRARTLTLYVNQDQFCHQTGIETRQNIALLLLNETNEIVWRGYGGYGKETAVSLQNALTTLTTPAHSARSV